MRPFMASIVDKRLRLVASLGGVVGLVWLAATAGCGQVASSSVLWFEATGVENATVLSQGPGRSLTLACQTRANGQPCRWTVRMLLRSGEALRQWSMDLLGESGNALLKVNNFNYILAGFTTAAGGEAFGDEPDLLRGAGSSTAAADGAPSGDYTLVQFELEFANPAGGPGLRSILAAFGADGWEGTQVDDQVPPLVQAGSNVPAPAVAGGILPNPVIILDHTADAGSIVNRELCGDGVDNDGDGQADCADSDCGRHPICRPRPTIQCPADLTLECDGSGNPSDVRAWLNSAVADSTCDGLQVSHDFDGLERDRCAAAGASNVIWTAADDCGSTTCSARLRIVDTALPAVQAPADLTFVCDGTGMQRELRQWLRSGTATDRCGDVSVGFRRGATAFDCSARIVWTGTDECGNEASETALLEIQGDTGPPTLTLNGRANMTLECGVDTYTEPGATTVDACDATLVGPAIGGDAVNTRVPGTYEVTYGAVDLCNHAAPQLTRTVTVVDTLPPRIELRPVELWPPNHEYVTLHLSDCATLIDDCEGELDINALGNILSVASSEPDDGNGDGNTRNDIVMVDHSTFRARAERRGGGDGRTYSIRFEADDTLGHRLEATCLVNVPHDSSGADDDDGDDRGESD